MFGHVAYFTTVQCSRCSEGGGGRIIHHIFIIFPLHLSTTEEVYKQKIVYKI